VSIFPNLLDLHFGIIRFYLATTTKQRGYLRLPLPQKYQNAYQLASEK